MTKTGSVPAPYFYFQICGCISGRRMGGVGGMETSYAYVPSHPPVGADRAGHPAVSRLSCETIEPLPIDFRFLRHRLIRKVQPQNRPEQTQVNLLEVVVGGVVDVQQLLVELAIVEHQPAIPLVQAGQ